jgi:hypothetical protein
MFGRKPKKPGSKVAGRVKKMYDEAAKKGESQYQSDLDTAKGQIKGRKKAQNTAYSQSDGSKLTPAQLKHDRELDQERRAAGNATSDPVKEVNTKKSSGMYSGSVPVAGTDSKKVMRQNNPIKGIKRSKASPNAKKSMIKKMRA